MSTVTAADAPQEISSVQQVPRGRKRLVRRTRSDRSQAIRHGVQWVFVALNLWIGIQFYFWVRYFERGGNATYVSRPAGVEGWLPIAGLMNLKYFLTTGKIPAIHPAAMFLLATFLAISVLMKKAFCSWLCPIGTLSENLWRVGRRLFRKSLLLPLWLDLPLRGLKYLLLSFFVLIIATMSTQDLSDFMQSPYAVVADVKMLNFFLYLSETAAVILLGLVALSMLIQNFWCRYLCPYGALMGLASLLSPVRIRRDESACIDCGKCSRVCPSHLPVDRLVQIHSVECTACMACVASCPAENALQFAMAPAALTKPAERWRGRVIGPLTVASTVAALFLGTVLIARVTGHWQTDLPRAVYMQLVPYANALTH